MSELLPATTELPLDTTMPPGAAGVPPALDVSVIDGLRALADGDDTMIAEIVTAFLTDGEERLRQMYFAIAGGDETAARRAAHSLKGMSGSIGAMHLSDLSQHLEKAALGAITPERIDALAHEYGRVSAALKTA